MVAGGGYMDLHWPEHARGLSHPRRQLRHRLNYAIDKDLLTEEVYQGNAKRMCSAYPETSWVYNPDVPCYDYDQDKAIAEFAEAGYTLKDDKMVDEKGEPLKLKLIYGHPSQTGELIAVTVQDYLAEIGIEVEIQPLEWASFLEAKNAEELGLGYVYRRLELYDRTTRYVSYLVRGRHP